MQRRHFLNGLALGVALSPGRLASAETVVALTLRQLRDASQSVVHAAVSLHQSRWVEVFGERRIVTCWQLEVIDRIAGTCEPGTRVATLGGSVGDIQQWVPHEAQLQSGKHYLLFLRHGVLGAYWVTGMMQGAFPVHDVNATWMVALSRGQTEFARRVGSASAALEGRTLHHARRVITALPSS